MSINNSRESEGREHRDSTRIKFQIDAAIDFLAPEETFRAGQFAGRIVDFSPRGLGFEISTTSPELLEQLPEIKPLARVFARLPGEETKSRILGKVMWLNSREEENQTTCRFGLRVDPSEKEVIEKLSRAASRASSRAAQQNAGKIE
jgi:hypothetical protein